MPQNHRMVGSLLWDRLAKFRARRHTKVQSRHLAVESLEDRRLLASGRVLGSITGTVFDDQNGDGVRAATERGLAGWVVYADRNNNGSLDRGEPARVSGRNGSYRLSVSVGTYTIRETAPAGWRVTTPSDGSYSVTVAARATVTGKDFGNQKAVATVSGTVFNDLDGDGTQDSAESGQSGWQVFADADGDGQLDRGEARAISGRDGTYRLTLTPGDYTILEVTRTGWQITAPSEGSYTVTVANGDALTDEDFGNQQAVATVSGTVFNDLDGDGTQDSAESSQSGWQVFADADGDGQYDRGEVSAISGRAGTYELTLTPGTYTIREVAQSGWQVTAPSEGFYTVTVANGDALTDQDFGNQEVETEPTDGAGFQITLSLSGLTASQQAIAEQAADRWEQVIVGDLPDVWYRGQTIDDVSITVRTQRMDGVGNVLGESGPEAMRAGRDGLPYLGTVVIDTADIAQMESEGELLAVLTHEIAHVLGFGTVWTSQGLLSGTRTSNPVFTGAHAVAEYNKVFGTNATGVPVEASGGTGTALGHWRLSVFGNELMVGYIQDGDMPLSSITVAAMADLGYEVNLAAADAYSPLAASSSLASAASSASGSTGSSVWTSGGGATTPTRVPGTVAVAPGPSWQHYAPRPWGSDSRTISGHSFASSRWQAWSAAVDDVFSMTPGWV